MKRRDTGRLGEKLAQDFVKKQGYHIIETNYRCPQGEVDIIARDKDCLIFIEVRTKRSLQFGSPEESITPAKMQKLREITAHYRQTHDNLPPFWRIDVVAVELKKDNPPRIELIKSAISED